MRIVLFGNRERVANAEEVGAELSDTSPVPPGQAPTEPVGPFGQLVADTIGRLGLSLREAAAAVTGAAWDADQKRTTVHASAVHGWIHGTVAQPNMRRWIAAGLKLSLDEVNAAARAQVASRRLRQRPLSEEAVSVKRRQFLIAGGAVAIAALRGSLFGVPGSLDDDSDGIEIDRLDPLVTRAWQLRQTSQYGELSNLLPSLLARLNAATIQLSSEADLRRLTSMTVHAHNAMSSLLRRLDARELAAIAADRAVQAASRVGDPLLRASASYRLANVLLTAQRHEDSQEVALTAAVQLEPYLKESHAHLAMWGGLLLTAAVAAARQHAGSNAWALLGQARTAGLWLGYDHVDLNTIFGPSNVAIHNVEVASDLGDFKAALEYGRNVDPHSLPAELVERRTTLIVNLARAHQHRGNMADALGLLLEAERLAPEEVRFDEKARGVIAALVHSMPATQAELRPLATRVGLLDEV